MFKFDESVEVNKLDVNDKEAMLGCYNAVLKQAFISENDKNKYMLELEFDVVNNETGEVVTQYTKDYFANEDKEPYNNGKNGKFPTSGLRVIKSIAEIIGADYKQLINDANSKVIERFGKKEEVLLLNIPNIEVFVGFEPNFYNDKIRPITSFIFKKDELTDEEKEKKCKALNRKIEKILKDIDKKESNNKKDENKSKYGWS